MQVLNLSYGLGTIGGDKDTDDPTDDRGHGDRVLQVAIFCTAENPCGSALCDYCG